VIQLYPLAIRDVCAGGKAGGRKFKARKRGTVQSVNEKGKQVGTVVERTIKKRLVERKDTSNDKWIPRVHETKIVSEPLDNDTTTTTIEPFPTMYWLTHPHLRTLISQLEISSTHNVRVLEERLVSCEKACQSMKDAHTSYGKNRWRLLTTHDIEDVTRRHWNSALGQERGVAGIRKPETIKCLHAHAVHFLAQHSSSSTTTGEVRNIVGKWVMEGIEELLNTGAWKNSSSTTEH